LRDQLGNDVSRSVAIVVLGLAVACTAAAPVGTETVDARYVAGGGTWNTGGGITAAVRAFEQDAATIICGAWTTDRQSALSTQLNENVISAASVYIGDTRVVQNLAFMARTAHSGDLAGAQANCIVSPTPWRETFANTAPRIRFPRMEFKLDDESLISVRFRETLRSSAGQ
jgi:hypothetical protein